MAEAVESAGTGTDGISSRGGDPGIKVVEIIAPLRNAMRFVDNEQVDVQSRKVFKKKSCFQPLGIYRELVVAMGGILECFYLGMPCPNR